jgi:hypothetical protein
MDGFTIGLILRQLISAGLPLKSLLGVGLVLGLCFAAFKAAQSIGGFLNQMLASRDASLAQSNQTITSLVAQTMQRVAEQDTRRSVFEAEQAKFMAQMASQIDNSLFEARETRKEMHQRFNKAQEDITTIKGAVS